MRDKQAERPASSNYQQKTEREKEIINYPTLLCLLLPILPSSSVAVKRSPVWTPFDQYVAALTNCPCLLLPPLPRLSGLSLEGAAEPTEMNRL